MKVLLTGGTGFVGSALREALRDQGHDVRLLVRRESVHKIGAGEGFDVLPGDVLDSHACLRAVDGVDVIVNLVGIRREDPQVGTTYEAMHTEATFDLVDAGRRKGVERFVQMSGLGTRADARSRYHTTKWEAEEIVRKSGMRWTIFRPSIIFGPGDEFHPMLIDLVNRPVVPIIDGAQSKFQPISCENIVDAMARCVTMPETQGHVYEAGGPDRVVFRDLLDTVARHCEAWMNTVNVSSRVMKPAVKFLQRFRSFPLSYDELLMLLEDNVCDNAEFVKAFGTELESYNAAMPALLEQLTLQTA